MRNDSTSLPEVDEEARRRFEAAWREGSPRPIEEFLSAPDHPHFLSTLEELVHIELENVWKRREEAPSNGDATVQEPARLEFYLVKFPQLNQPEIIKRLG